VQLGILKHQKLSLLLRTFLPCQSEIVLLYYCRMLDSEESMQLLKQQEERYKLMMKHMQGTRVLNERLPSFIY